MRIISLLIFLTLNIPICVFSQTSIVPVGEATIEKSKISLSSSKDCQCVELMNIIRTDLSLYRHKLSLYDSDLAEIEEFDHEFIVKRKVEGENTFEILHRSRVAPENKLEHSMDQEELMFRELAHQISNSIFEKIFKRPGIFRSKIYFISDKGRSKKGLQSKQLFVMDYDGENSRQLTFHDGYVFSPAVSSDNKFATYSVILNNSERKNVNLYLLNLETGKYQVISNFKGINSGAVFVPDSKEIILTLTHSGNAELYRMNLDSKQLVPLTRHFSSDVDPSISPDGKLLSFLSTRAGKPMIYTMDPSKTEYKVKRVSFVGEYNATPRFSPNGQEIIFSSWLDNRFDLFRLDRNGMNLVRLTKDHGSNEAPSYSPDGELVVFSSQRIVSASQDVKNLYIMTREGEILKKVTTNLGKTESPSWVK